MAACPAGILFVLVVLMAVSFGYAVAEPNAVREFNKCHKNDQPRGKPSLPFKANQR